jgi:S1-C subfamily serine protease
LAILAAFAMSTPARAADWWWIGAFGEAPGRLSVYVDKQTIFKSGKYSFTVTTYYVSETPYDNGEMSAATMQTFDCKAKTFSLVARRAFDGEGKELGNNTWENAPSYRAEPGTTADMLLRYLCRTNPPMASSTSHPGEHAQALFGQTHQEAAAANKEAAKAEEEPAFGVGTGFFVDRMGMMVTSYHVVADADQIIVYSEDGAGHKARITKASVVTDVAVLAVDYRPKHYLTLAPANSTRAGDRVFTFGFPVVQILGREPKFSEGAISSLSGMGNEPIFAQITVPVQPGNSGGPLVNERGEVVGVVAAVAAAREFMEAAGALPQNVNWAVRSEYVAPLIPAAPRALAMSRNDAVALVRASVALVLVKRTETPAD